MDNNYMSDDALRVLGEILDLMKNNYPVEKIVSKYDKIVLDLKEPELSYYFVYFFRNNCSTEDHMRIIIDSEDPYINYLAACDLPSPFIFENERVVLKSENPEANYFFARDVKPHVVGYIKYYDEIAEIIPDMFDLDDDGNPITHFYTSPSEALEIRNLCEISEIYDNMYEEAKIIVFEVDKEAHREVVEKFGNKEIIKDYKKDVDGEFPPKILKKDID